ncbi:hypothetical protein [Bradyrhizobium tunisiense]|uniref:hypothetical protein n=1 Tax=Bradyrhizobium tunisiense TaxID=3278709 RepID=UPI0035E1E2D2
MGILNPDGRREYLLLAAFFKEKRMRDTLPYLAIGVCAMVACLACDELARLAWSSRGEDVNA